MTDTAGDGATAPLTRAQRRRKRSWLQRRRARRSAQRRDADRGPRPTPSDDAATDDRPDDDGPSIGAVATVTGGWPPEPEAREDTGPTTAPATDHVEPAPATERVVSAPTLEAPIPTTSRRERRTGGRSGRDSRRRPARAVRRATASAVVPTDVPAEAAPPPTPVRAPGPVVPPVAPISTAVPDVGPAPAPVPPASPAMPEPPAVSPPRPESRRARRTESRSAPKPAHAPKSRRSPASRTRRAPKAAREPGDRRFWTRVMPTIAGLLVIAVVVGAVVRNDDAGPSHGGAPGVTTPIDERPVLIVHRGPTGSDLIVIADRDGDQGSVLFVPVATQVDVPSQGTTVLSAIPTLDGGALLTSTVENATGIRIGRTVVLDDAALTAALGPAAPFPITLNDPVGFSDRSAKYRAGAQQVSAAQASELMSAPESVNELDRLVVVASVLDGWMDRLRDPAVAQATLALQPSIAPFVAAAGASNRRIDTVPVASIATGGGERFDVRPGELRTIVQRAFPHSQLGDHGVRPRVEILNGTGALGVAQVVTAKVVPAGGRVTLTDNLPGFGLGKTQVVYYSDRWRDAAQALLDAMGCGSLRKAGQDVKIADVTILVGSDCPAYGNPGGGT